MVSWLDLFQEIWHVHGMSKQIVKEIADALGDDVIATAVSVSEHSVRNARWKGSFPASWYPVIRKLCEGRGQKCPESAFTFKSPSVGPKVSACNANQDRASETVAPLTASCKARTS